jgi:glycosyltransferase involved in cell wall biosynthesis
MTVKYVFWNDDTGYGTSAKQMIKGLIQAGIKVIAVGLEHHSKSEYQLPRDYNRSGNYEILILHSAPYYIARLIEPGKINIAYCTWETSVLPQPWVKVLNRCHAVFVPSSFNKQCFESSGVTVPVKLLPHISEFSGTSPLSTISGTPYPAFTFYSIGMWTNRKNNQDLIKAFRQAFTRGESVRLIIKTSKKDYTRSAINLLRKLGYAYYYNLEQVKTIQEIIKSDNRISISTESMTPDQIASFHARYDCFVSLCHSEGWGLGAYEAAWFGKPVIITGYGGHLDFLPGESATLLPYQLVNIKEKVWTEYNTDGQQWAEVDMRAAIEAMQNVYHQQSLFKSQGLRLQDFVRNRFNEKRILETFILDLSQF